MSVLWSNFISKAAGAMDLQPPFVHRMGVHNLVYCVLEVVFIAYSAVVLLFGGLRGRAFDLVLANAVVIAVKQVFRVQAIAFKWNRDKSNFIVVLIDLVKHLMGAGQHCLELGLLVVIAFEREIGALSAIYTAVIALSLLSVSVFPFAICCVLRLRFRLYGDRISAYEQRTAVLDAYVRSQLGL